MVGAQAAALVSRRDSRGVDLGPAPPGPGRVRRAAPGPVVVPAAPDLPLVVRDPSPTIHTEAVRVTTPDSKALKGPKAAGAPAAAAAAGVDHAAAPVVAGMAGLSLAQSLLAAMESAPTAGGAGAPPPAPPLKLFPALHRCVWVLGLGMLRFTRPVNAHVHVSNDSC